MLGHLILIFSLMKKLLLLTTLLCSSLMSAQDQKKELWFGQDFEIGSGISNLIPNESMMGDAHRSAPFAFFAKIGIAHYKKFTLGIHGNASKMRVKNPQYYGLFKRTSYFSIGPYASFYQPIAENFVLEPYISYDYTEYTGKSGGKKLRYDADGLGIGVDFAVHTGNNFFVLFGLKYSISKLRANTHPDWEKYLNNYNYFSAKIAFKFAKYRF